MHYGKNDRSTYSTLFLDIPFDRRAIDKEINADVSVTVGEEGSSSSGSVKYHARPLYEVCRYETLHGTVVPVPEDYFA